MVLAMNFDQNSGNHVPNLANQRAKAHHTKSRDARFVGTSWGLGQPQQAIAFEGAETSYLTSPKLEKICAIAFLFKTDIRQSAIMLDVGTVTGQDGAGLLVGLYATGKEFPHWPGSHPWRREGVLVGFWGTDVLITTMYRSARSNAHRAWALVFSCRARSASWSRVPECFSTSAQKACSRFAATDASKRLTSRRQVGEPFT